MSRIITLTTDFGLSDAYTGAMKGVILSISPQATIVDISHAVPPQDVRAGSLLLGGACRYFPPGTIHVAVVDPGVGTNRRAVALAAHDMLFVGPDNGLFSFALQGIRRSGAQAVHLTNHNYWLDHQSATFHGRDIFAPVAAHLSLGVPLSALGPSIATGSLVRLSWPAVRRRPDSLSGQVIYIDHFGNAVTNITAGMLSRLRAPAITVQGTCVPSLSRTYADVQPGHPLALIGSTGYLEIAISGGSAAASLGLTVGTRVRVTDGILER